MRTHLFLAALAPDAAHSPNADDIRIAFWVSLVVVSLIGLLLVGSLIVAVRRFRSTDPSEEPRRLTAGRGVIAKAAGGLGAIVLAMFIFGVVTSAGVKQATAEGAEEIEIDAIAQQWLWRFEYPAEADGSFSDGIATVFSYSELVVPEDTVVNLTIDSTDVIHSWFVPALGPQVWAVPGELIDTSFIADEEGLYHGRSTVFSGSAYPEMRVSVKVVSQAEYQDYISGLNQNLAAGQEAVQESVEAARAAEDSDETSSTDAAPAEPAAEAGS